LAPIESATSTDKINFGRSAQSKDFTGTTEVMTIILEAATTENIMQIKKYPHCVTTQAQIITVTNPSAVVPLVSLVKDELKSNGKPKSLVETIKPSQAKRMDCPKSEVIVATSKKEIPSSIVAPSNEFEELLTKLAGLGFEDREKNEIILRENKFDFDKTVLALVDKY